MSDVYKFRVTIELEIATHRSPREVRDFLRDFYDADMRHSAAAFATEGVIEEVSKFHVRAKRLDDWAYIGELLALHLPEVTCPHCGSQFKDVTINVLPFQCPICQKRIPVEAEGRVKT